MEMNFEEEMKRLNAIVAKMQGEIPLEESLKLYTEAVELSKKLTAYINDAKLKVTELGA